MKTHSRILIIPVVALGALTASAQQPVQKKELRTLPDGRRIIANELKVTLKDAPAHALTRDAGGKAKAVEPARLRALHPSIIRVEGRHTAARLWLDGKAPPARVRRPDGKLPRISRKFSATLQPGADAVTVRAALLRHPDVESVDLRVLTDLDSIPNDPGYPQQWAPPITGLETAWEVPGRGPVRVAVIDTGLQLAHPEFAGRVVFHDGYDDFDDGEAPATGSGNDHGTHVAGIIAATRNNNQGVAGYSNDIQLMIHNCAVWDSGTNTWRIGSSDDAMDDAVANGASVINCSFGFNEGIEDEVEDAFTAGVLVVHSAGNNAMSIAGTWESGSIALLTISATLQSGMPATDGFAANWSPGGSNFGPGVDLAAPGTAIWSTIIGSGGYGNKTGTSMATPQVSGAAALMMSMNPNGMYTDLAVRHLLVRMAIDKGADGYDEQYGYGVLRLRRDFYQVCRDATAFVKSANNPTSYPQQTGSYLFPWHTLGNALANVPDGATLVLNGGITDPPDLQFSSHTHPAPPGPINKRCVLTAVPDRPVVIGVP